MTNKKEYSLNLASPKGILEYSKLFGKFRCLLLINRNTIQNNSANDYSLILEKRLNFPGIF
jgi:hypothetical protein